MTRTRVLEATRAIIGGKGDLTSFSMEAVARKAGVARMTVYYQFHSREQLLDALADHLAEHGGMRRMREVFLEADPAKALRRLVEVFVSFWASDRVTLRRLRAMGVVAPRQDRGPRDRDAWRREAVQTLLTRIARTRGKAKLADRADLVDLVTSLTSFETFDVLCTSARAPESVASLLSDLVVRLAGID
ncbi:MAG: TetR/AcrR family transcriptional regulator [Thermoplasmata archaeon]|nr:TetR/AcrR family transcriptional regulator [Thermoplasmata archaeon]